MGRRVPNLVKGGGQLRYDWEIDPVDGRGAWIVVGVHPDGSEEPVLTSTSGMPKRFRTIGALVQYHRQMFPHAPELILSIPLAV